MDAKINTLVTFLQRGKELKDGIKKGKDLKFKDGIKRYLDHQTKTAKDRRCPSLLRVLSLASARAPSLWLSLSLSEATDAPLRTRARESER